MDEHIVSVDEELKEIIPQFLKNREEDVEKLKKALGEKDYHVIEILGHNMKGAGSGYGFHEVTRLGKALEEKAKKKEDSSIQAIIQELASYMDAVEIRYQ